MKILWLILIIISPGVLQGQSKAFPVNISFFNESTAIPFTRLITLPVHPGIQIGTEFTLCENKRFRIFQTANISYYFHNHLTQGIGILSETGFQYQLTPKFSCSGLIGFGHIRSFAISDEYRFEDGGYVKKADHGNSRIYPSLSLDLAYKLKKDSRHCPQVFLRYQSWAEYPYSPGFIPVMTHVNLHIGTKIFFISKHK